MVGVKIEIAPGMTWASMIKDHDLKSTKLFCLTVRMGTEFKNHLFL